MVETSPNKEVLIKENIQDLIEIANIDISCDLPDPDVHPHGIDSLVVSFDKVPHEIKAGETRTFPRYLADHYVKHLVDHILTRSKKQVRDPSRGKIEAEAYRGVRESFSAPRTETQGEVVEKVVQEANVTPPPTPVPPPAPKTTGPVKERPTREALFAETKELGIETKGDEKVDELIEKIQTWAGVK